MTEAEAQINLDNWLTADTAIQKGQSYSVDGLSVTRADAETITAKINYWQKQVNAYHAVEKEQQQGVRYPRFNS